MRWNGYSFNHLFITYLIMKKYNTWVWSCNGSSFFSLGRYLTLRFDAVGEMRLLMEAFFVVAKGILLMRWWMLLSLGCRNWSEFERCSWPIDVSWFIKFLSIIKREGFEKSERKSLVLIIQLTKVSKVLLWNLLMTFIKLFLEACDSC